MPNNDLISRASVLEALNKIHNRAHEYCYENGGGERYDENNSDRDIVLDYIQSSNPLSAELESLVNEYENEIVLRYHSNDKEWVARYYPSRMEIPTINSPTNGFGKTPLAAVLALKEALNSKP